MCVKNYANLSKWACREIYKVMFLFMRSSVSCIVMYGTIKLYAIQIYAAGA